MRLNSAVNWLIAGILLIVAVVTFVAERNGNLPVTPGNRYEADLGQGGSVEINVQSCDLRIVGSDENKVRVHYWNNRNGEVPGVNVQLKSSGKSAEVNVQGGPSNNFHIEVQVPKRSDLYARMFAGEMNVSGVSGDKDVEMQSGKLTVTVGDTPEYESVDGAVLSGRLNAEAFNVDKGGLFRSFEHKGPGEYRLHARVNAGELMFAP